MTGVTCSPSDGIFFPQHQDQFTLGALLDTNNLSFENNFFSYFVNTPAPKITCSSVCPVWSQALSVGKKLLEQWWLGLCCHGQVRPHMENGSRHHAVRDHCKWNYLHNRMTRLLKNSKSSHNNGFPGLFSQALAHDPSLVLSSLSFMTRSLILPLSVPLILSDRGCALC